MEVAKSTQLLPGDPRLVDHIVGELKSQGIFDQFRKECIADVDTKPAYQNLRQRVEGNVTSFLNMQRWKSDMNKNQVREMLRKNIQESGFLETGVERIVDQVVNPKINTTFFPQVEDVVYKFLGMEKPGKSGNSSKSVTKPLSINTADLLPTDLDPVSPASDKLQNKTHEFDTQESSEPQAVIHKDEDMNDDDKQDDDSFKLDDEESPPFEPIGETSFTMEDENTNDSNVSGISGLSSHASNTSITEEKVTNNPEINNADSNSHTPELVIDTKMEEDIKEEIKMEVTEEKDQLVDNISEMEQNTESVNMDISSIDSNENSPDTNVSFIPKAEDKIKAEKEETNNMLEDKIKVEKDEVKTENKANVEIPLSEPIEKKNEKLEPLGINGAEMQNDKSKSKVESSANEIDKNVKTDKPDRIRKESESKRNKEKKDRRERHSSSSSRNRDKEHNKSRDSKSEKDRKDSKRDTDKHRKDEKVETNIEKEKKDNKTDTEKNDKSKEKDDKHRSKDSKSSSSRDKKSEHSDDKTKSSKHSSSSSSSRHDRKTSSSSKDNRDKDRSSSKSNSSKAASSSTSREQRDTSKDNKESESKVRSDKKYSEKKSSTDAKPSNNGTDKKHKDDKKKDDKTRDKSDDKKRDKSIDKSKSKSHESRSKDKSRHSSSSHKSSSHDRNKKDSKKESSNKKHSKDDHSSSRDKNIDTRRSADRDSNDGSSGNFSQNSNINSSNNSTSHNSKNLSDNLNSQSGESRSSGDQSSDSTTDKIEEKTEESTKSPVKLNVNESTEISLNSVPNGLVHPKKRSVDNSLDMHQGQFSTQILDGQIQVKLKKPKFASNIFEARRLMKIRKRLEKLERKRQRQLNEAQQIEHISSPDTISLDSLPNGISSDEKDDQTEINESSKSISTEINEQDNVSEANIATSNDKTNSELESTEINSSCKSDDNSIKITSDAKPDTNAVKSKKTRNGKLKLNRSKAKKDHNINECSVLLDSNAVKNGLLQIENEENKKSNISAPTSEENNKSEITLSVSEENKKTEIVSSESEESKKSEISSLVFEENKKSDIIPSVTQDMDTDATSESKIIYSDDEEDCLYLIPENSPTTERFLKEIALLQKRGAKLFDSISETDDTLSDVSETSDSKHKQMRRSRKPNLKYCSDEFTTELDENEVTITTPVVNETKKAVKTNRGTKRKLQHLDGQQTQVLSEKTENNNIKNDKIDIKCNENTTDTSEKMKSTTANPPIIDTDIKPVKKQKLRKNKRNMPSVNDSFVMPLSPESDVSIPPLETKTTAKSNKEKETVPKKVPKLDRATKLAKAAAAQRYSSDDLYKPRPIIGSTRRSRAVHNQSL